MFLYLYSERDVSSLSVCFFGVILGPPISTRTYTLLPYSPRFRSERIAGLLEAFTREADDEDRVAGRHAHAHDRAGQRRHRQRRMGGEQHPDDAGDRGR